MKYKSSLILVFALFAGVFYIFPQISDSIYTDTTTVFDENIPTLEQRKQEYTEQLKLILKDTAAQSIINFKSNYRHKYNNDPDFDYTRSVGGKTFWNKLKERFYNFLQVLFGWDKNNKVGSATEIAFYIVCAIVILIIVYFIVRILMKHEGKWFFQNKNANLDIDANNIEHLINYADFEKMIFETESKGDTRQSIRLYYLWLLRTLNEKKIIEWNPKKTNSEYQNEIKTSEIKQTFTYLSYLYNHIWYGEFSITDTDYVNAKKAFLTYLNQNENNG